MGINHSKNSKIKKEQNKLLKKRDLKSEKENKI
jgi:hypothetical protein